MEYYYVYVIEVLVYTVSRDSEDRPCLITVKLLDISRKTDRLMCSPFDYVSGM